MLVYRLNFFTGILTYVIYTGGFYFLWSAVYGDRPTLGGMTAVQMTTYLVVSWMTRAFYFNNLDREIADEIRSGLVAIQLIRPYNYLLAKITSAFGEGLFRLVFWMVPGMFIASLLFPVAFSDRPATWALWILSGLLAFVVNALINALTGLISFYLNNAQGILYARSLIVDLLSGLFLPLHFYPDWFQSVVKWLPFQSIAYLPNMIFTEGIQGAEIWRALATQAAWALLLTALVGLLWRRARRFLVVQGG